MQVSDIGPQNAVPLFPLPFEKLTYPSLGSSRLADKLSVQFHAPAPSTQLKYTEQQKKGYTRVRGYKTFSHSTRLSKKFILLINVKMPTIVGILTFNSIINTRSESLKVRKVIIFLHVRF